MKRLSRVWRVMGIMGAVLTLGSGVTYGTLRWQRGRPLLPEYREPGPGPRAPTTEGFGFHVGDDSLAQVSARTAALQLPCEDRSARVLLRRMRAEKMKDLRERAARGEKIDTVSSASWQRPSARERNPQVRWDCQDVAVDRLVPGGSGTARLLLVFDSPGHPLRHVSLDRSHAQVAAARADFQAAYASLRRRFGEPTSQLGAPPLRPDSDLPHMSPVAVEWRFADLQVKLSALNLGPGRINVGELIEVPVPLRPDAPHRPAS